MKAWFWTKTRLHLVMALARTHRQGIILFGNIWGLKSEMIVWTYLAVAALVVAKMFSIVCNKNLANKYL